MFFSCQVILLETQNRECPCLKKDVKVVVSVLKQLSST